MKNILVTGGSGFIGSALINNLVSKDNNILSIDNYFSGNTHNNVYAENVQYLYLDTNDILKNSITMSFKPDIVYHLGEYSRIVQSFNDIRYCQSFNSGGTFNVLEYCRETGAKLIYAGSSSKFGNDGMDENLSPYAWWKAKNTELINNYHQWFGLDFAIAYFYNVYGPGQITSGSMATVIGIFQDKYKNGLPLTVVSPGNQCRDFTHIDDIIDGLILVGEKGNGDDYLLGTGKNYTLLEIAQAFNTDIQMIPERKGERFTSCAYPTKAFEELGWVAKNNVIDYIQKWVEMQSKSV